MNGNYIQFFSGLAVMAGVTYLVRMLPLVLVKKDRNRFINLFLLCPVCGARRYDGSRDIFIHSESPERDSGLCCGFDSRIFRARSADCCRRVLRRRIHSGADNEIHSLR